MKDVRSDPRHPEERSNMLEDSGRTWIRSGLVIFITGYGAALVSVMVIAHAVVQFKQPAEWFHRLAM